MIKKAYSLVKIDGIECKSLMLRENHTKELKQLKVYGLLEFVIVMKEIPVYDLWH